MKTMRMMNGLIAATLLLAAACAGEPDDGDDGDSAGYSAIASDQARGLGIDSYLVRHQGGVSQVQLLDIDGQELGVLTVNETPEAQSAKFVGAGSSTSVVMSASKDGYSIAVDGEARIHVTADQEGNVDQGVQADLSDVEGELALLAATMNDGVHVMAVPADQAAYMLSDCPWWVSLLACAGCATVGEFIAPCITCGACLASYLV